MMILTFKLVATPLLILVATLASRRWGQSLGGWLVGLPLTSGPVAVFLALEHGPVFARSAAIGSLEGTAAHVFFVLGYIRLASGANWVVPLLVGTCAFILSGLTLAGFHLSSIAMTGLDLFLLTGALWLTGISGAADERVQAPRWDLPLRMAIATLIVLGITSFASMLGPTLSGLAATFPVFATILGIFAHRHGGPLAAQRVLRGLLLGLFSFVGFFLILSETLERAHVVTAFVLATSVAFAIQWGSFLILRHVR